MKRLALRLLAAWLIVVGINGETRTFAEIAGTEMLEQTALAAEILAKLAVMPPEQVDSLQVDELKWEVSPRGKVRGVVCDYEFSGGLLTLKRRDLVTLTNGHAPIMDHKTNAVLVMKEKDAREKAFKVLGALGFDEKELRKDWKVRVERHHSDRGLIGRVPPSLYPVFYSRHPIELSVALEKKGGEDPLGLKVEFLGTTGELLELKLWDHRLASRSGLVARKIRVESAADFNPPLFFYVVREFIENRVIG